MIYSITILKYVKLTSVFNFGIVGVYRPTVMIEYSATKYMNSLIHTTEFLYPDTL